MGGVKRLVFGSLEAKQQLQRDLYTERYMAEHGIDPAARLAELHARLAEVRRLIRSGEADIFTRYNLPVLLFGVNELETGLRLPLTPKQLWD